MNGGKMNMKGAGDPPECSTTIYGIASDCCESLSCSESQQCFEVVDPSGCSTTTCVIASDCCESLSCNESQQCVQVIEPPIGGVYEIKSAAELPSTDDNVAAGNPMKGFLTSPLWIDYQCQQTDIPTSLDFYFLGLDRVMTGDNTFAWSSVHALLARSANENLHAIPHFILDYSSSSSNSCQRASSSTLQRPNPSSNKFSDNEIQTGQVKQTH